MHGLIKLGHEVHAGMPMQPEPSYYLRFLGRTWRFGTHLRFDDMIEVPDADVIPVWDNTPPSSPVRWPGPSDLSNRHWDVLVEWQEKVYFASFV